MNLLTYPEAANYLRISESSLRRMVSANKVKAFWLNRCVRFDKDELDKAVQQLASVKTRMRKEKVLRIAPEPQQVQRQAARCSGVMVVD